MNIAIGGKKRAGKDTVAELINFILSGGIELKNIEEVQEIIRYSDSIGYNYDYIKKSFAESLKDIVFNIYNVKESDFISKDAPSYDLERRKLKLSESTTFVSYRYLLQDTADRLKASFGDNIFIDILLSKLNKCNNYIISDLRYYNEYQALKSRNFIFIKVEKDLDNNDKHSSENEIVVSDNNLFDFTINNNGDLYKLYLQCLDICGDIKDLLLDLGEQNINTKPYKLSKSGFINSHIQALRDFNDSKKYYYSLNCGYDYINADPYQCFYGYKSASKSFFYK